MGAKTVLDRIPYEDAVSIRIQLIGHYGKQDITDSIVENGDLCLKTKPISNHCSAIKESKKNQLTNATQKNIFW